MPVLKGTGKLGFNGTRKSTDAVTQITSIATGVRASGMSGQITTFASTLAAAGEAEFIVTNNRVKVGSVVSVAVGAYAGAGTPVVSVRTVGDGVFTVTLTNLHVSAALDAAVPLQFAIVTI